MTMTVAVTEIVIVTITVTIVATHTAASQPMVYVFYAWWIQPAHVIMGVAFLSRGEAPLSSRCFFERPQDEALNE